MGLEFYLNPEIDEKSRDDHRHHFIDALVIANTTPFMIQKLSSEAEFSATGRIRISNFPNPFNNFLEKAADKVRNILISYKSDKRLISTRKNKLKNGIEQKSTSIRGTLHKETNYGLIANPHTGEETFVYRKPITEFSSVKQIEKIIDPAIREIIINEIEKNDGNIKKALNQTIYIKSKNGRKKTPIKSVRISEKADHLIHLRPEENEKLFVASGNNYRIVVYENNSGDRYYETVTFFDAAQRALKKLPVFSLPKPGYSIKYNFTHNEYILISDIDSSEIDFDDYEQLSNNLYKVIKFGVDGRIVVGMHNLSNLNADRDQEPYVYRKNFNTLRGIQVRVNSLGKIISIND